MSKLVTVALVCAGLGLAGAVQAQPAAPAAPAAAPETAPASAPAAPAPAKLTTASTMKDLLANPGAKTILQKHIPQIVDATAEYTMVLDMTLDAVSEYPQAGEYGLTADALKAIREELAKL